MQAASTLTWHKSLKAIKTRKRIALKIKSAKLLKVWRFFYGKHMNIYPRIGIGVCVIKDGKVLLGKRINAHGQGTWAFPGGHLEFGETVAECAMREVEEEIGMKITNIRRGPYTEDFFLEQGKHYITIIIVADWKAGKPELREPHKCEQWSWLILINYPNHFFQLLQIL